MKRTILSSELIINSDGSIFHLHLAPSQLADTVILVGDPARADYIATLFEKLETSAVNREFHSHTGFYNNNRLTVVSTGIGCDNIDIVLTELDALVNIDFATRTVCDQTRQLTIVRLGTSGAIESDLRIGDYVMSEVSIGIDGLLNFYDGLELVSDLDIEREFVRQTDWNTRLAKPYCVYNDGQLLELFSDVAVRGITISAGGFYAPQGRVMRLALARADYLERIEGFEYHGRRVTNFEMEGSAIAGLSALMGHRAMTVCAIIAQRLQGEGNADYQSIMEKLIKITLEKLTK